ncbi:GNAT family N-acetyltransferase [Chitinimonas koreensis]|uniref:GNAT family N-acetyltransferase n=1 Tax=Chitinimonas koreensis TaxID=356302 RepID=UPI0003F79A41|nr:GNAT family N-acetyltransferase [Chitinimonas koreensis]QNM97556.1 GNAT family N-acetyltransferase [Chitinimonas koreensis]
MSMVELRPMAPEEVERLRGVSVAEFADEAVRHGRWTAASRDEREAQMRGRLPRTAEAGDHYREVVCDGAVIGRLWYSLVADEAYLFDILIEPAWRGRGLGRAAMAAFEAEARTLGARQLALNVFVGNAGARGLYEALGYGAISQQMVKAL